MGAFDQQRPPEREIVEDCVHCGFCLDSCPTYALWANEADSPRGRIVLIGEGLNGAELSDEMVSHLDRCLGCMACVTACPSGVRYDRLIERARPQIERHHRRGASERALRSLLFATLPHPGRLRLLAPALAAARRLGVIERLPGPLGTPARVAPRAGLRRTLRTGVPARNAPVGEPRGRVALLLGCVQRVFYPQVHRATVRALAAEGFEVLAPRRPGCCGALELHGGAEDAAVRRARETIAALDGLGADHIVV